MAANCRPNVEIDYLSSTVRQADLKSNGPAREWCERLGTLCGGFDHQSSVILFTGRLQKTEHFGPTFFRVKNRIKSKTYRVLDAGKIELFLSLIDIMTKYYNQKFPCPQKSPCFLDIGFRYRTEYPVSPKGSSWLHATSKKIDRIVGVTSAMMKFYHVALA